MYTHIHTRIYTTFAASSSVRFTITSPSFTALCDCRTSPYNTNHLHTSLFDCLTLKLKAVRSFEKFGTTYLLNNTA